MGPLGSWIARGLFLCLMAFFLACATAIEPGSGGSPYPAPVRWDFTESCQKSAQMTMGYSNSQRYCACLIDEFQARFSLDDFKAISQGIRGGVLPPAMADVVDFCRRKKSANPK